MEDGPRSAKKTQPELPDYCLVDGHKVRNYDIKTTDVPRLNINDPEAAELISSQKPVVLTGTNLIEPALHWNLEYLRDNIGDVENAVYLSESGKFMYFDDKRCKGKYADFQPPTQKLSLTFNQFYELLRSWKEGDKKIYFQQMLTNRVKDKVVTDFLSFNWGWLGIQQQRFNWGPLTSNLLLVSQPGNVTPLHYDEQENFFAQARGFKRCMLFPPSQFKCFYPFPFHHPCDRQSQVDFDSPEHERFPLFKKAVGREVIVGPGDVLYIPVYWWHYIESVMDEGPTISINFWYKSAANTSNEIPYPLKMDQKVAIMRNIEKLLGEALGDADEVNCLLNMIVNGRYPADRKYFEEFDEQ